MKLKWVVSLGDEGSCTAGVGDVPGQSNASIICAFPKGRIGPHKTFSSRCALGTYNCQHKSNPYIYRHDGPCNNSPPDACSHVCLNSSKVVCGGPSRGRGENITFQSKCEMQNFNCGRNDNETYVVVYEGKCEDISCHRSCSTEEAPICARARDGTGELKTFKNPCQLDNYNCDYRSNEYYIVNLGACGTSAGQCNICSSSSSYHPICGKSANNEVGKTFANQCELDRFNCLHNTHYEYRHDGRCVRSCTYACRQDYNPICVASLRGDKPPTTLHNRCYLDQHNCEADIANSDDIYELLYIGECQIPTSTTSRPLNQCPKPCPGVRSDVCASSSGNPNIRQTFYNRCELENHNCVNTRDEYNYIHDGKCERPSSPLCRLQKCPIEHQLTICASPHNGIGPHLAFSGNCSLQNYNCHHSNAKYVYLHDGQCKSEPSCKKMCANEVSHVCGISKPFRSKLTFKNLCEMDNYNCDHGLLGTYEFLSYGKCDGEVLPSPPFEPICQKNCSTVHNPVCATALWGLGLKKEFHNQCYLDKHNCEHFLLKYEISHTGQCRPEPLRTCVNTVCTQEYLPICGASKTISGLHKTFSNQCMMDYYNCQHERDQYEFLHNGVCKSLPAPPSPRFSCIKDCECTYNPVCAKSRYGAGLKKEFTNRCKLDNYNCENYLDAYDIVHEGKCGIFNNPSVVPFPSKICVRDCSCEYEPVCAGPRNGIGSRISFTNRCKLDNFNCENSNNPYQIVQQGLCQKNEKLIMAPTEVSTAQSPVFHDCFRECPQEHQPICGKLRDTIGLIELTRTFKNQCEFENHNCLFTLSKYDFLHAGQCAEPLTIYA